MPKLGDLTCVVEWANTGNAFPEYGTTYGSRVVETYILVPAHPQVFTIRLTSNEYISEGLAMIVFVDGNYHCNRNRVNLLPSRKEAPKNRTLIDFIVRQKEKPIGDGTYMGREWRFDDHNIVSHLPPDVKESHFDELGNIEVLVLRCKANHAHERIWSTSSSGEDSQVLGGEEELWDVQSSRATEKEHTPKNYTESEFEGDPVAGLLSLFDGSADYPHLPGYYDSQGDAPAGGYYRSDWRPPIGHHAHYPPQGPRHPPLHGPHQRRSPPLSRHSHQPSYAHDHAPPYGPPKPERRVHFDYGDHRGIPYQHYYHPPYSGQPPWTASATYNRSRMSPEHHYHGRHPRGPNPYADEPVAPPLPNGHYMYDAEHHTYREYPDYAQDHRPVTPPAHLPSHLTVSLPHTGYGSEPPSTHQSAHWQSGPPHPAGPHVAQWTSGQPPLPPQHVPLWFPPNVAVAHPFPGIPLFHSSTGQPFFPPQHPNTMPGQTQQVGPPSADGQKTGPQYTPQPPGGFGLANNQNNASANGAPAQGDQNWSAGGDTSGENNTGTSDANSWKNNANDTGNNNNPAHDNNWENNGVNNDNNQNKNDEWNNTDHNDNTNGNNDSNDNDNTNGENNWSSSTPKDGNQQNCGSQNSGGWDNNNNSNHNNGGGGWSGNNQNSNGGNAQSNGWNNDQNNNIDSNANQGNTPTPIEPSKRSLYGPHGAYFTSKAFADPDVPADAEEEPRYDVPRPIAQARGTSKQVQPGKGYIYHKKQCAPIYLDTLDEPYSRFIFRYRTKEQIKNEIGIEITAEPTGYENVDELQRLDKSELIQMVIRAKDALGGEIPASLPKNAAAASQKPAPSFEQVPIDPPDTSFLKYNLPPARAVHNSGLGIRASTGWQSGNGGNSQQNRPWNDNNQQASNGQSWASGGNNNGTNSGSGGQWNDGNNNAGGATSWNDTSKNTGDGGGGWDDQANNVAAGGGGWDGQQENANGNNRTQPWDQGNNRPPSFEQQNSHTSSAISAKGRPLLPGNNTNFNNGQQKPSQGDDTAKYLSQSAGMSGPPPPSTNWSTGGPAQAAQPPPVGGGVQTVGTGFLAGGGGGFNYHDKPPTPPVPPCSPDAGGAYDGFGAVAPRSGW